MLDEIGLVHGRFQVFHNDHLKYALEGKKRCKHLIVGICNPDVSLAKYSEANPHRSSREANPFTFYERYEMIKGALLENGLALEEFDIVPFPINYPELIENYAPREAKYYLTIYDEWGREKKRTLEALGLATEVLWDKPLEEKELTATDIRDKIRKGEDWKDQVPAFVYEYICRKGLAERLEG